MSEVVTNFTPLIVAKGGGREREREGERGREREREKGVVETREEKIERERA